MSETAAKTSELTVTNEAIKGQLNWRYAVKKFDATKKVSDADFQILQDSLVLSPASYGLQLYKFVIVTDENVKKELLPHAYGQSQVVDCSHLIVIASKDTTTIEDVDYLVERIIEVRGTPREMIAEYEGMMKGFVNGHDQDFLKAWNARQAYIALGFLMETAALKEIDTCPMEGFDPKEFSRILGLDKEGFTATVICPIGYRDSANDWLAALPKVRYPESKLVKTI